eukprot:6946871-Alexandrium_andersonii.AAC.1
MFNVQCLLLALLECPQHRALEVSDHDLHLVHDSCGAVALLAAVSGLCVDQVEADNDLPQGCAHA